MIINQINYGNSLSETTATSKDIAYNKIGYSSSEGKIVGTAPFEYNENYKILNAPLKLTTSSGYSGLLVETDNTSDTWNKATFPSISSHSVCYGNGKFVAIKSKYIAAYSEDGVNWTEVKTPISAYSSCYGNGKYVAISSSSAAAAMYSEDGINWTQTTIPTKGNFYSVCYGNDIFVAVANETGYKAMYSKDGITWTQTSLTSSITWCSVCYGNGKFVAVSSKSNIAICSEDGITWNQTILPTKDWVSVCYGNDRFVAVNSGTISAYITDKTYLIEMIE